MLNRFWSLCLLVCPVYAFCIPDVSLEVHRFRSGQNSFAEISLYIVGSSLTCKEANAEYGVTYTVIIENKDQSVVSGDRYKLVNSGCPAKDLIDVRRYMLSPGDYYINIEMTDVHDSLNTISIRQQVEMQDVAYLDYLSDVQLLSVIKPDAVGQSTLHKSGLYLEPLPFRYYYPALDKVSIYVETYNADKLEGQPYLQYALKPSSGEIPAPIIGYRKVPKESVSPNIYRIDISSLISGPYVLETSLFDGNKKLISKRAINFSRYNPIGDSIFVASGAINIGAGFIHDIPNDSLDYHLRAMIPIVSSGHADIMNALLDKGNSEAKKFFIHRYWTENAGKFADEAFAKYMYVARVVDEMYGSGFGYGFETDRGHIFLKYGRPDDIIEVEDEPSAPPYEIWFYNQFPATHQSNVRFLFYNPSLAKNAYTLLHSTAIGEIRNDRWEIELYRDATLETPAVGETEMGDNVHRNARKYFENY